VLKPVKGLELKGHCLYCDNYYTSALHFIKLALVHAVLLVGTVEPTEVIAAVLKKGEMSSCEVERSMLALKWMDK